MLAGAFVKNKSTAKYWAIVGIVIVLATNGIELLQQQPLIAIDVKGMLHFNSFNLTFVTVMLACTLLFFLLNGRDFEK